MDSFESFAAPIRRKLTMMGYDFKLYARTKTVYSVYKNGEKGIPFEQIYDLLAARIVFEPSSDFSEKDQCWMIYSAITEIYRPHPERIRDWISMPKANGYEALHVTVMGQNGQWIEVQIRTKRMHELAEHGLAAHWRYKTGENSGGELDKWLKEIKDVLANPDPDAIAFLDTFKLNLLRTKYLSSPQKAIFAHSHREPPYWIWHISCTPNWVNTVSAQTSTAVHVR